MSMGKNEITQEVRYMQALKPASGYSISFAVGTTFSLSMEALLAVPLAFGSLGDPKELSQENSIYIWEGIRRGKDLFVLFCNKGSIHIPHKTSRLYSLMEDAIIEVSNPENRLANFHPKMWIVRETSKIDKDDTYIKIIVTSRNLTFAHDIDVAIYVKGRIGRTPNTKNEPLKKMLDHLADLLPQGDERVRKIKSLGEDLLRVDSFDFEFPFTKNTYTFYPYCFGGTCSEQLNGKNLEKMLHADTRRMLIISPFVEPGKLCTLTEKVEKDNRFLVTRENNVTEDILDAFNEVYVPNSLLQEFETPISLHAKIYLVEKSSGVCYLYFGSANATHSAFSRNAELTIGVKLKEDLKFDDIKEILLNPTNAKVEEKRCYVRAENPIISQEEESRRLKDANMDHILRWAMDSVSGARVTHNSTHNYSVELSLKKVDHRPYNLSSLDDYDIFIRPIQLCNHSKTLSSPLIWENLELGDLSELYVVRVKEKNTTIQKEVVFKVKTKDLPKKDRNNCIEGEVINASNIEQYIQMMLSDFPEDTFDKWSHQKQQSQCRGRYNSAGKTFGLAIYEQLLKMKFEDPTRLDQIKSALRKVSDSQIKEQLTDVLKAFNIKIRSKKK